MISKILKDKNRKIVSIVAAHPLTPSFGQICSNFDFKLNEFNFNLRIGQFDRLRFCIFTTAFLQSNFFDQFAYHFSRNLENFATLNKKGFWIFKISGAVWCFCESKWTPKYVLRKILCKYGFDSSGKGAILPLNKHVRKIRYKSSSLM